MNKSELIKLRSQIRNEIKKRQQINQYLDNQYVLEYLKLVGENTEKKDLENIREIVKKILNKFEVRESNGIYVCTKVYDEDYHAPIKYYCKPSNNNPDHKCYMDIESKREIITDLIYGPSIYDFEKYNIVLNPYNASYDDKNIKDNGYEDVRLDFFEECFHSSQQEAVKKLLKKYPRL